MGQHLLVVDDEPEIRELLQRRLKSMGNRVTVAANGEEALKCLESNPDISGIISDLHMPVMSGFDLIKNIKDKNPGLPVLVITGFIDDMNVQEAKKVGASAVLPKPINWSELQEWLENLEKK